MPAVVTPFDSDFRFAPAAFERLLARLYEAGVHGIYVCGQTGEGLRQPLKQRKRVAETAVRCSPPGKTVIVHVGCQEASDAAELARHAAEIGAAAVSSLPPADRSIEQIREYYRAVAQASELPFLVYYFPEACPVLSNVGHIQDLLEIPNVVGLKFTDYNLFQLSELRRSGAVVFNGRDEVLAAGLLMRANGGIGSFYNVVPELFLRVHALAGEGRYDEAYCVQLQVNELIEITCRFPPFPAIKRMLAWSGLDCGGCLPPVRELTQEEEAELRRLLAASSLAGRDWAVLRV